MLKHLVIVPPLVQLLFRMFCAAAKVQLLRLFSPHSPTLHCFWIFFFFPRSLFHYRSLRYRGVDVCLCTCLQRKCDIIALGKLASCIMTTGIYTVYACCFLRRDSKNKNVSFSLIFFLLITPLAFMCMAYFNSFLCYFSTAMCCSNFFSAIVEKRKERCHTCETRDLRRQKCEDVKKNKHRREQTHTKWSKNGFMYIGLFCHVTASNEAGKGEFWYKSVYI